MGLSRGSGLLLRLRIVGLISHFPNRQPRPGVNRLRYFELLAGRSLSIRCVSRRSGQPTRSLASCVPRHLRLPMHSVAKWLSSKQTYARNYLPLGRRIDSQLISGLGILWHAKVAYKIAAPRCGTTPCRPTCIFSRLLRARSQRFYHWCAARARRLTRHMVRQRFQNEPRLSSAHSGILASRPARTAHPRPLAM